MPDHVDHVRGFDSTRGYCSCLGKWIGSLISKSLNGLVVLPFRTSLFRFIAEKENCHLSFFSAMDPIEITSSDSDYCGMENDAEEDASPIREFLPAHTRTFPSLEATLSTHSRSSGFNQQSCRVSSPKRVSTSNGVPLDVDLPQSRLQYSSNSVGNNDAFNRKVAEGEAYQDFKTKGIRSLPRNFMDVDSLDEASNSKYLNTLGKTLGNLNWSDDDDVVMLNSDGSKILPPSLMHGKSASTSQFVCSRDLVYHSSIIEERASENDERIFYQAALQDLQQPKLEATLPDGLMTVSLLRHQKIALAWMLQKETKSTNCLGGILADDQGLGKTISMIALIQMQKALQSNSKVKCQRNHKTEALNLDEDDDTGYSGSNNVKHNGISDDVKVNPVITSLQALPRRPTAGTLVVCPPSVLRQWARELDYKVADEAKLSVLMYHGGNRTKDPVQLAKYDVVLTTYSIVANEVPKRPLVDEDGVGPRDGETYGLSSEFSESRKRKKTCNGTRRGSRFEKELVLPLDFDSGALAKVVWYRVILDEAQTIKNHRTRMARSCCSLRAKRRWCLSGTPIQNSIDDLYSYFRFLKCEPYCGYKSFCHSIKNFIARDSVSGYKKLQAILFPIMLRRTKETLIDGEPIIKLPPKSVHLTKVDFSTMERALYLKLEAESHSKFKAYAAAGTVNQNYANILLMLLRLRQACDHPLLVKGFNSDSVGKVSVERAKRLSKDSLVGLLNILETSLAICHVCKDPPEDAVVTLCGHIFCYQCISEYITGDEHMCPTPQCKKRLRADIIFSGATLRSCICDVPDSASSISSYSTENSLIPWNEHASSKISAALQILQLHCKSNGSSSMTCNGNYGISSSQSTAAASHMMGDSASQSAKAIIFSQWTRMMDLVEISLKQSCIQYRRLDGTMTLASRDKAVKDFNTDPQVTVMLMSLKAGNLGLNMVSASHVILLDLWWNPTTEDQAIDRAHRIGQTRPVIVSRITIKDTVEDRILALQEEKRKMVASAFGEDQSGGSATRLTVEDLHYLFTANRDR